MNSMSKCSQKLRFGVCLGLYIGVHSLLGQWFSNWTNKLDQGPSFDKILSQGACLLGVLLLDVLL